MAIEDKFWLLYEDEPIDIDHSRFVELKNSAVLDARTGAQLGTYEQGPKGFDLTMPIEGGDTWIWQLSSIPRDTPFNPKADAYMVNITTKAYEEYATGLDLTGETEDQAEDREDWEYSQFGGVPTYGSALRDGPSIYEIHEENKIENPNQSMTNAPAAPKATSHGFIGSAISTAT